MMNTGSARRHTPWLLTAALLACACGSDGGTSTPTDAAAPADVPATATEPHIAVVVGALAAPPTMARTTHDTIAGGGEAGARRAGNAHHEVFLGIPLLGTTADQFLATDRWSGLDGARAVYGDPAFRAAFATLFAAPAAPTLYSRQDWYQWGSLDAADSATPRFFVVVRGRLASADLGAMRATHDAVARGGEAGARMLGDVAHVVFTGADDPRLFLAVDVWTSRDNITALYGNPDFAMRLAPLFEAPPTLGVYQSTDWHQW